MDYINRPNNVTTRNLCLYQFVSEWIRIPESQVEDPTIALRYQNGWQIKHCCVPQWDRSITFRAPALPLPSHKKVPVLYSPSKIPDYDINPLLHCQILLVLFRPWRKLSDLLNGYDSWITAYKMWSSSSSPSLVCSYARHHLDHLDTLHQGQKQQLERRKLLDEGIDDSRDDAEPENHKYGKGRRILGDGAVNTQNDDHNNDNDHNNNEINPALLKEIHDDNSVIEGVINGYTNNEYEADYVKETASLYSTLQSVDSFYSSETKVPLSKSVHGHNNKDVIPQYGLSLEHASLATQAMNRTYPQFVRNQISIAVKAHRQAAVAARTSANIGSSKGKGKDDDEEESKEPIRVTPNNNKVPLPSLISEESLLSAQSIATKFSLNTEQRVAFFRIAHHLRDVANAIENDSIIPSRADDTDGMVRNKQLLMAVLGPGGTGKTRIIQAVQSLFDIHRMRSSLRLAAFMGQPASRINGQTLASMLHLRPTKSGPSDDSDQPIGMNIEVQRQWMDVSWLIIDEVSLVGLNMLARLNKALHLAKCTTKPFGGLNVIFFGDFIQFPPVQDIGLWSKVDTSRPNAIIGQNLWSQISDVVILHEQMRQTDVVYASFLSRLRNRQCTQQDVDYINTRVINELSSDELLSFQSARTIVTRISVRDRLNMQYTYDFAREHNRTLYIVEARDVSAGGKSFDDITQRILLRSTKVIVIASRSPFPSKRNLHLNIFTS